MSAVAFSGQSVSPGALSSMSVRSIGRSARSSSRADGSGCAGARPSSRHLLGTPAGASRPVTDLACGRYGCHNRLPICSRSAAGGVPAYSANGGCNSLDDFADLQ